MKRVFASALLVLGVLLVFAGISAALGFTPTGMLASGVAIAALLYVGAVWFAPPPAPRTIAVPDSLIVFDRRQRIVSGPAAGDPVTSQFADDVRGEIDRRCAAALAGTSSRFPCHRDDRTVWCDALPVRDADGAVVYGILLVADSMPAAIAVSA